MANLADTLQRTLDNYGRLWLLTTEVIANPTQQNIDTLQSTAEGLGVVTPKPTYSLDGENYDWAGYQEKLDSIMQGCRRQLIFAQGPVEVRSRSMF